MRCQGHSEEEISDDCYDNPFPDFLHEIEQAKACLEIERMNENLFDQAIEKTPPIS